MGNIGNARTPKQIAHMKATVGKGKCPFCKKSKTCSFGAFNPKLNKVILKGKYWQAWFNPFPYKGSSHHIVIASIKHWTSIQNILPEAWAEWGKMNQYLIKHYKLPGGGIVMRFGKNKFNGGTLRHAHSHIQVPSRKGISVAVFYKPRGFDTSFKKFLAQQN